MTTTQTERTRAISDGDRKQGLSEMQKLARRVEQHYTAPLPEAEVPARRSFPASVVVTLWLAILGGAILGAFAGRLLQNNTLVIPSAEGLYSMTPLTFQFFWVAMGIVLGIVVAAVATLFMSPHGDAPRQRTGGDGTEGDLDGGEE